MKLAITLFFLFSAYCFASFQMGSFYDSEQKKTYFRLYATNADNVELVLYATETGEPEGVYEMKKFRGIASGEDKAVAENTWEIRLPGEYAGHFYQYKVYGNNCLEGRELGSTVVEVNVEEDAELFLFNKEKGWLQDTTAPGYMEEYGKKARKTRLGNLVRFELTPGAGSLDDYHYEIAKAHPYWDNETSQQTTWVEFPDRLSGFLSSDPYCYQISSRSNRCEIVDFGDEFAFSNDSKRIGVPEGHVIHEVHVKDLTRLLDTVPESIRGTYKAMAHPATLRLLRDMHVRTVELLPVHQNDGGYWGYNTKSFFAVHDGYASEAGQQRKEFKEAVEALHRVGIAVIIDVVYNHTPEGNHRGHILNMRNHARNEYYHMHDAARGYYWNGSGCGNCVASHTPVARKLILDSLKFWAEQYQIDGFRFDLAGLIDKDTLIRARQILPEGTFLSGEPWGGFVTPLWARNDKDLNYIRFGKWNDKYRLAVKGGGGASGFVNGEGNEDAVKVLIRGENADWGGTGSHVQGYNNGSNLNPESLVNYIAAHDGYTLYDWLQKYGLSDEEIQKRMRLSNTILLTSVNTPMVQLGQEFGRTKNGNHNSYQEDDETNWIDWSLAKKNAALNDFTNGLKALRDHYDAFHFYERIQDDKIVFLEDRNGSSNAFGYRLKGSDYDFIVLLNGSADNGADFDLPGGNWKVISNGEKVSEHGLGTVTNQHYYLYPGAGSAILRQKH
jgi:pullulanase/glycogen debranching enzyme